MDLAAIPEQHRRLVAREVGASFRDVAHIHVEDTVWPGEGEVLVKISFAGINGGCETFRARGEYAFAGNKGKKNFRLGAEAVGVVAAVGDGVENLKPGDSVTVLGGGYGDYVTCPAAGCFPVREATAEAVAVTLSGLTAAGALLLSLWPAQHKGGIRAGETVLVTAAAGGTGHFGVQIAKLQGCRVVATAGGPEKAARLRELGADRVIDYREEDVAEVLRREFPGQIDVAYEGVGGPLRDAVLANLAPSGRVLAVGYISEYPHNRLPSPGHRCESEPRRRDGGSRSENGGAAPSGSASGSSRSTPHGWDLPPADKLMWEAHTVRNGRQTVYGDVWPEDKSKIAEAKSWLFEQYYGGAIQAWIDPKPFKGLDSVADATEHMLSGGTIGKVVVDLR